MPIRSTAAHNPRQSLANSRCCRAGGFPAAHRSSVRCRSARRLHRGGASSNLFPGRAAAVPDSEALHSQAATSNPARAAERCERISVTSSPVECRLPGQHFVQHATERENVRALVDRSCLSPVPATCTPPFPESLPHSSPPCSASANCDRFTVRCFAPRTPSPIRSPAPSLSRPA